MGLKIVKITGEKELKSGIFQAKVVFPSENEYPVEIRDPFLEPGEVDLDREERLRWYFEKHLASPYTDREKAKRAKASIAAYGESLFADLFKENETLQEWRCLVNGLERIRVQVFSVVRAFQALHWEALKDPKETLAFGLTGVEFTRTSGISTPDLKVQDSSYLHLLMVTARPGGKNDVEYRTIARPVVDTLEKNRVRVKFTLLRPPTFQALKDHLLANVGIYHILHLDVHGSVLGFAEYEAVMQKKDQSGKRRPLAFYKGTQAFIALVGDQGGADLVPAQEVAVLLRQAHVPICFLNACQSGMATTNNLTLDASLAMTFLESGVRLVLGMAWSLTVTGAGIMMKALYDALTRGEEPVTALGLARRAMNDDPCRLLKPDLRVDLEDWLLPVVWGKGDFSLSLRSPRPEEDAAYLDQKQLREKELEGVHTEGQYGFLGRDVDILAIETLLMEKNILLIKGMGGTGKTTLLGHLALWWLRTGWVDHIFYFGYDRKPFHAEEILNTIAETIMPREQYGRFLVIKSVETKAAALAEFLKESKETPAVLVMLDNLESVTGTEQAVGSRLEKKEQDRLARTLQTLMRSSAKILLGSRAAEEWLGRLTFKDRVYVLEGLDRVSRFALAGKILAGIPVDEEEGEELNRLMEILAGYPLAMEIILPNLRQRSARELRQALTGADVDFTGEKVSDAISRCINISFSLLTPGAQERVLVFAPFTSFLNTIFLDVYLKALQGEGAFAGLTKAGLDQALAQAEGQGLLKEIFPRCFAIQPVFPFFLGEMVERLLTDKDRSALDQAFCTYMTQLAEAYKDLMESKEPGERQRGFELFRLDRENLYQALHRVLDREGDFYSLYIIFAQFYHQQPLYQEAIAFMAAVVGKLDRYSQKDTDFLENYAYVVGNLGSNYFQIKNFSEAKKNLTRALELLQQAGKRQETAAAYHQLGMVAEEERDWESAKANYREALKIFQEFNDRHLQATVYHQLGMVAEEERDWESAKANYREALKIDQEFQDRYSQARTFHQLGMVAQAERDWESAKANYREALKIYQEFNDRYEQAGTFHQLGYVAQEERDWESAKANYREALKIDQEFNDRYSQASTYHQLGMVAEEERDWESAKANYREALKIDQEFQDRYSQASTFFTLGSVAEEEKEFVLSLGYLATALEIYSEYKDNYWRENTLKRLSRLLHTESPKWDPRAAIDALDAREETKEILRNIEGEKVRR